MPFPGSKPNNTRKMKTEMKTELMTRRFLVGDLEFETLANEADTGLMMVGYVKQTPDLALYIIRSGTDPWREGEPPEKHDLWRVYGVSLPGDDSYHPSLEKAKEWASQEWRRWLGELRAMETVPAEAEGAN